MDIHSEIYKDEILKLRNENQFLKDEHKEETEKLADTIDILNKELEEVKNDNRTLNKVIENYQTLKAKEHL